MAIKTEITASDRTEKPGYPYLGISKTNKAVVLFTNTDTGLCVHRCGRGSYFGEFIDNWRETNFEPLQGALTLRNDE